MRNRIRPERCPWGLIGAIVAALLVERAAMRHADVLCGPEHIDWAHARAATREAARDDLICLGSSLTSMGVYPQIVESTLGRSCYNLATNSGRPELDYFSLRRVLRAGGRPTSLVIDVHPGILTIPGQECEAWTDALTLGESLELAWAWRDPDAFLETLLRKSLFTLHHRPELRLAVRTAIADEPDRRRIVNLRHVRNMRQNCGAIVAPDRRDFDGTITPNFRFVIERGRAYDPVQLAYLQKLLDLAAAHQIHVYWVLMPFSPPVQALRDTAGLEEPHERLVARFLAKYANVTVVDARRAGFANSVFQDACHLSQRGAVSLSAGLAEVIQRDRRNSHERWVPLPQVSPDSVLVNLEDIVESQLAVEQSIRVRR